MRNESTGNLNDLLDSLNRSQNQDEVIKDDNEKNEKRETSTASETGGSQSESGVPLIDSLKNKTSKQATDTPSTNKHGPLA